jgi:hypothetical protein
VTENFYETLNDRPKLEISTAHPQVVKPLNHKLRKTLCPCSEFLT